MRTARPARRTLEISPEAMAIHYFLIAAAAMQGLGQRRAAALTSLLRLEPDFSLKWLSQNMA